MIYGIGKVPDEIKNEEGRHFLSPSALMQLHKSPAHYAWRYIDGHKKTTPSMQLGTYIHEAILEPHEWNTRKVMPEFPKKSKDQPMTIKAQQEEWLMLYGEKSISTDLKEKVELIKSQFYKNEFMGKIFENGNAEIPAYWEHKSGIIFRMKTDWVTSHGDIVDVKTTQNGNKKKFAATMYTEGLYIQAAIYMDAFTDLAEKGLLDVPKIEEFMFATVETGEPYISTAYTVDFGSLEAGRQRYEELIEIYLKCKKDGSWPGYSKESQSIALPNWAWYELEDNDDFF